MLPWRKKIFKKLKTTKKVNQTFFSTVKFFVDTSLYAIIVKGGLSSDKWRAQNQRIETVHLHNEVSRRGLNGDSPVRASPFLLAFVVSMRFPVGAGSNKRTVGRFSFCGILPDPYSLPVSLFCGGSGGSEHYPSAMYRSSSVTRKEPWWKSWALSLTVPRQPARRCLPVDERRNYHFIDIESPSSLCRDSSDPLVLVLCSRGRIRRDIFAL